MSEDHEPCPKCGNELMEFSDAYDVYPDHVKYVRWVQCPVCNFEKVLEEKDI